MKRNRKPKDEAPEDEKSSGGGMPLVALVSAHIRRSIENRALKPGDAIDFVAIGEELKISRTPIRESIGQLQLAGLIESLPGGQFRVAVLTDKDVTDYYAVRHELELSAAAIAAQQITKPEIALLRGNLAMFDENRNKSDALLRVDRQFHEIIYEATRNRYLAQRLKELRGILGLLPKKSFGRTARIGQVYDEHVAIVEAMARHDSTAAVAATATHIENARLARSGEM